MNDSGSPFGRWVRRIGIALGALGLALVLTVIGIGLFAQGPGGERLAAGMRRNEARYVTMRDGVRLAVDVWYPPDLAAAAKVPALIRSTRYVRAQEYGPIGKVLAVFGKLAWVGGAIDLVNGAGYVVVLVDARGSGASFGSRDAEWTPEEVADMGDIVDWIVAQPWSNGRVGGFGVSYEGNTAELLAATGRPAVRAVAPLFDDYDPIFTQAMAGGAFAKPFLDAWGAGNNATDANDICRASGASGVKCAFVRLVVRGTKPVDGDSGRALLAAAVQDHVTNYDVSSTVAGIIFPRDTIFPNGKPNRFIPPYLPALRAKVEANNVPMLILLGWYDAGTVNTGLGRFLLQKNPMQVEIGPWGHGGGYHVDPFLPPETPTVPSMEEQAAQMIAFFDTYLKGDGPPAKPIQREIRYFTMNGGDWKTTPVWPPADLTPVKWYLGADHGLAREAPAADSGSNAYQVDLTATTGHPSRWDTQLGGGDVIYPDRAAQDKKLLTYTSEPLAHEMEITGAPMVSLEVSSTATDGLFFVYLEDVAPDGRVTYLTEGLLRALHRKVSSETPPYPDLGPYHTFRSTDGMPLVPGERTNVSFALYAVSVRVKAGHRIRVAIAGHDDAAFTRVPVDGAPVITIFSEKSAASLIEIPMKELP
ncbi:MAG: CocE/NonD family hydrolase [Gemmatimonadota bacterium]